VDQCPVRYADPYVDGHRDICRRAADALLDAAGDSCFGAVIE
jgi:hypothetical protein